MRRAEAVGRCPRKWKESQGNPAAVRAAITTEGPGTGNHRNAMPMRGRYENMAGVSDEG